MAERYGEQKQAEPERLHAEGLAEVRSGPLGLLGVVSACEQETKTQMSWLRTRLKQAAPQALLVAE